MDAEFVKSSELLSQCPPANLPEYAFIGRSNVGKSSLINYLTGRRKLAVTSSKPGKTKLINHFLIDKSWYLVDLPGYGYAVTSKSERRKFEKLINGYIHKRANLINVFVLIDLNVPPQELDLAFMEDLGMAHIPFCIVFTKSDKSTLVKKEENLENYKAKLLETWESLPDIVVSSVTKDVGQDELLTRIKQYNSEFRETIQHRFNNQHT